MLVTKVQRIKTLKQLLPGIYDGNWRDYEIRVEINENDEYLLIVDEAAVSTQPVRVVVHRDNSITIKNYPI